MQLESFALTHQGLVRPNNQDSILALPELGLFAVADGMGGEQAGDEASQCTVATIRARAQEFFQAPPQSPAALESFLRETLQKASQDVFEISVREPRKRGLGSTASLLCLQRGIYTLAQVGDSRIYLVRGGAVRLLTRDHTLVWMLYEQGALSFSQLERHPERHLLTQCIGALSPVMVDTAQGALQPGDLFLICSDGLTGYVDEARVHRLLLDLRGLRGGVEGRAKVLLEEALRAGGGDNISVILVRVAALEAADDWVTESLSLTPLSPSAPAQLEPLASGASLAPDSPAASAAERTVAAPSHHIPAALLGLALFLLLLMLLAALYR